MRQGLVVVNTGDGKGKTTAALGLLLRAWGRDFRICMIQFIKYKGGSWGEVKAAERLGIEWHKLGEGFNWRAKDLGKTILAARNGWKLAQEKIASGNYDLVILDEFTYPLYFGWLDAYEVIAWLKENKPSSLHLVITGRDALDPLIEYADLVTEMHVIKHPYDLGVKAQPGIEF
jgi:cob(I)alamin adenosyltransferase